MNDCCKDNLKYDLDGLNKVYKCDLCGFTYVKHLDHLDEDIFKQSAINMNENAKQQQLHQSESGNADGKA